MKFYSIALVLLLLLPTLGKAQNDPLVLPRLSESEIAELKPATGMVVYNTTKDAIYYYGNDGWFAFSGECIPKPVSPRIDSALVRGAELFVYFSPVNQLVDYVIEDEKLNTLGTVNTSPAVLTIADVVSSVSVRAKSRCGSASPLGTKTVEIIDN